MCPVSLNLIREHASVLLLSKTLNVIYRKHPTEVLYEKKMFLKFLQNSQENNCAELSILINYNFI